MFPYIQSRGQGIEWVKFEVASQALFTVSFSPLIWIVCQDFGIFTLSRFRTRMSGVPTRANSFLTSGAALRATMAFAAFDGRRSSCWNFTPPRAAREIVGQLYNFKDKGDREISLRPEMTPTLA